jgi:hypothetical protein
MAGCVLSGKPKTAATPPPPKTATAATTPAEPLSIPQTNVDLPRPQRIEAGALDTAPTPTPAPQAQTKPPVTKPPVIPRPATTQAKPAEAPPPDPPPTEAAPEAPHPEKIHEILSADEQNKLRDSAHSNQAEAKKLLAAVKPHTADQQRTWAEVDQFVKQSVQAEATGDMRMASQLAERANVLAKDLQSGK